MLQQCLTNGLVIKKIHRVLSFNQQPWLKTYIDLNTLHRSKATNEFEKNFFKLMNNAVYGKTMENVEKRKDVRLVTKWNDVNYKTKKHYQAKDLVSRPNFHSISFFADNFAAIQLNRDRILYDKPIYLGFSVLELSKWLMYDFHYGYMKPKYGKNVTLNYMDTDSFIYTIKTEDFYDDIKNDIEIRFDTSDYPINNIFNIPLKNRKVLGMMKDENSGRIMKEFVGLRPKMYALSIEGVSSNIKKSKGVQKSQLVGYNLATFRNCLYSGDVLYGKMTTFQSKLHKIHIIERKKITLSSNYNKRYIRGDNINTYP